MPETRYNNKSKGERIKPLTKVIIRRLPPTMNEVDFLKHIDPMPDHDYYYFVNADLTLGQHASARAYINFKQEEDIYIFRDKFDGYIFLDDKGLEYPACVEFAPFQDLPKVRSRGNRDNKCNTLELDQDFIDFLAKLNSCETENESKMEYSYQIKDDKKITTTPLLEYIAGKTQEQTLRRQEERDERRKRSAASVSQDDGTNKKKSTLMETELQRKRNRYPKLQSAIPEEDDGIIVRTIKSRVPNIASGMDNNNNNNNRNRKDRTVDAKQKQRETIKIISSQSEKSLIVEATPITIKTTSANNTTTSSGSSPISTISSTSSASVKSSEAIELPSKINTTSTTTTAVVASNQNKYNDVRDRDRERDRDRTDERNTDRKFYKDNEYRNERNRRYGGGGGGDGGNIKDKDDRQRNRNDENDYRRNHKDTRKDTAVSSSSNNRKRENDRYFSNNTKYERNKDLPSSSSTSNNNLRNGKSAMETKDGVYKKSSSDNQRQRHPMETTNKITILTKGSEKDNENKAIKNSVELKKNTESSEIDDVNNQLKDTIIQDDIRKLSNGSSNDESLKPSPTKPSPPTKTITTNREDKGRTNERNSNRRIRNKDRPSIEIYQPGRRRLGAVSSSSSSSANGNGKSMKNDENDNDVIDNEQTNKDDSFRSQIIKTIKDCKTAQQTCNEFINRINHHDDDDDDADDDDESMNEINRKNISSPPPQTTPHQTTGTAAAVVVVEKKIVRYSQLRNRAKERREITKEDFEPISEE